MHAVGRGPPYEMFDQAHARRPQRAARLGVRRSDVSREGNRDAINSLRRDAAPTPQRLCRAELARLLFA